MCSQCLGTTALAPQGTTHITLGVIVLVFSGWDSDMSSILLLLHLMPPSPGRNKRPGKLSARQATDHLVKFMKVRLQSLIVSLFMFKKDHCSVPNIEKITEIMQRPCSPVISDRYV